MYEFFKERKVSKPDNQLKKSIDAIQAKTAFFYGVNDLKNIAEYQKLKSLPPDKIKSLISKLIHEYNRLLAIKGGKGESFYGYEDKAYEYYADSIIENVLAGLLRKKLNYNEDEWIDLFEHYKMLKDQSHKFPFVHFRLNKLPITYSIKQLEYYLKGMTLSEKLKAFIQEVLKWEEFDGKEDRSYYGSDMIASRKKLESFLVGEGDEVTFELKTEDLGPAVNDQINDIKKNNSSYSKIFLMAADVSGSKPSAKFKKELSLHLDIIGLDAYRKFVHKLLQLPLDRQVESTTTTHNYGGDDYHHTYYTFLCGPSQNFIKGLVWTCNRFSDKETILLLIKLAEKCFTKIPGKGPAAASVGNACVYVLGNMKGKDGLGALSRLKLKVRQNNVKKMIDKLLLVGAKKYNVSVEELKEMAVPNYGMEKGAKHIEFDDYILSATIDGSKLTQQWIKPDGSPMKSMPSKVKNTPALKKKLATLRKEFKETAKVFSAQKQRIDNQFILGRTWDFTSFKKFYVEHGLIYPIASKLIWSFKNGNQSTEAILLNGQWKSVTNDTVDWLDEATEVRLWHPVNAKESEIVAWREKMMELEWKQPIKQAYREIYILTDAEINTKTYSNRMAAHILKQHQFSTLANLRNWKYSLMGWYDDGRDNEICSKELPEHNIKAEFWIDELNQDDAFNDAGIWLYVATDQVKFKNLEDDETIDLVDIPRIVLTEVLRDVDLFVGVASVGNDPEWMDNNGERQTNRDYWQSYSFGDLSEIAKTRKEILGNLLPRLKKIRDKAKIDGKFLIVQGQLRTYKIHIGSGNILMEPNDQYLCIVPSRSTDATKKLFIPFEGDRGLSIVLSKAFLLAEDDKIEDSTINSQING